MDNEDVAARSARDVLADAAGEQGLDAVTERGPIAVPTHNAISSRRRGSQSWTLLRSGWRRLHRPIEVTRCGDMRAGAASARRRAATGHVLGNPSFRHVSACIVVGRLTGRQVVVTEAWQIVDQEEPLSLADRAVEVLRRNDCGGFVKPGPRVYPFQWNWDSAFVAIGLARVDPERGRVEVRSLLRGQWADGMVPHIVFHPQSVDYSPGTEVWSSSHYPGAPRVATSGLTQPPVLASAVRALHEADPDCLFLEEVLPAIDAWHSWLERDRTFDGSGLVAILHPWESADNAPRFDAALARIEPRELTFTRSDRRHLDAAERPTDLEYGRYLRIVERLRDCGYRPASSNEASFAYVDLCFNAVLAVAESDLAWLFGEIDGDGQRAAARTDRLRTALAEWWDEDEAAYRERDFHGAGGTTGTVADLFPLYAGVPDERQARKLFTESLWSPERFGPSEEAPWAVTTVSKSSAAYDPRRYWRGPVWVNVNWFLIRGLERYGLAAEAGELRRLTLELLETSGFAEYYHPSTGEPLGSGDFSWSAALALDLLA